MHLKRYPNTVKWVHLNSKKCVVLSPLCGFLEKLYKELYYHLVDLDAKHLLQMYSIVEEQM